MDGVKNMKYDKEKKMPYVCDGCRKGTIAITGVKIEGKSVSLCADCVKAMKERMAKKPETTIPQNEENNEIVKEIETTIERQMSLMDEVLGKFGIEVKSITVRKIQERKRYIRGL